MESPDDCRVPELLMAISPSPDFEETLPGRICGFRMFNLIRIFFHTFHFILAVNDIASASTTGLTCHCGVQWKEVRRRHCT